jgi:enediyne biosynthesis protein E5
VGQPDLRVGGLRRFATAISILTVAGHLFLGFEQSYAHVLVALIVAYASELALEAIDAWARSRAPRWAAGSGALITFLLPAHITALSVALLLYPNERLMPVVLAVLVGIGSKYVFRLAMPRGGLRHFFNPSNAGISFTLLALPWVGIAPPYQFTENLSGIADWLLPCLFITVGSFLNLRFTRRIPLILAWLAGFFLQAVVRAWWFGSPVLAGLNPMTGVAFLLFTFYMITDPATSPADRRSQVMFGAGVAAAYGLLVAMHIVFGLFFALLTVCIVRGLAIFALNRWPDHVISFGVVRQGSVLK